MDPFVNWPPTLPQQALSDLETQAIDYAVIDGLLMKQKGNQPECIHAPITLFPSPFPRQAYEKAIILQPLFNKLVHQLSKADDFLISVFEKVQQYDEFTAQLFKLWKKIQQEGGRSQSIQLGIFRSDYMIDTEDGMSLKQVELNTISCSFSSLSSLVRNLHHFLALRTNYYNHLDTSTMDIHASSLPENESLASVAASIALAFDLYKNPKYIISIDFRASVLMVVQPNERNIYDQRWIEYMLFKNHHVKLIRKTLAEIQTEGKLDPNTKSLYIGKQPIAVVYFRAGYSPADYPSQQEWEARLLMEQSNAILCPTLAQQLVGAKIVQQVLTNEQVLKKFVTSESESQLLQSCFTKIYNLDPDSEEGKLAYKLGTENPTDFVLKPQREGGGNNFYGQQVKEKLKSLPPGERNAYILMKRLHPPSFKNVLIRNGQSVEAQVISELGIFGIWVSDGEKEILNQVGGHLLRTKTTDTDEGGVASGFSALDSPLLF